MAIVFHAAIYGQLGREAEPAEAIAKLESVQPGNVCDREDPGFAQAVLIHDDPRTTMQTFEHASQKGDGDHFGRRSSPSSAVRHGGVAGKGS